MKNIEPLSIDTYSRNNRLLNTLNRMGLAVIPIYNENSKDCIEYFIVSSGIPDENIINQGQDQG